jgi:hypothetical protein
MTALPFGLGHNSPPQAIDRLPEALRQIGEFLKAEPAIQDHATARIAAELRARAKAMLGEVEDERKEQTGPLNNQLREINERYKEARQPVEQCVVILSDRIDDFLLVEERRRLAEAEEKQKAADEAARAAYEASAALDEAVDNADQGEVDIDIVAASVAAQAASNAAKRAEREAIRAEQTAHVKIGTGMGRAVSLRSTEILFITDPVAALNAIGMTDPIAAAILTAARTYRQIRGELPPGVSSRQQRKI